METLWNALVRSNPFIGLGCWAMGMIFLAGAPAVVWGQAPETTDASQSAEANNPHYEYNVKAAFLYSFGRYIQWPGSAFPPQEDAFVICLFGEDPFGDILNVISKTKTIQGHRIVVQTMSSIKALTHCHILFIPRTIQPELQFQIINELQDLPILVVGESPGFVKHGGCVNFYMDGDQVRFEINSDSIRQKKLIVDAKLLNLGKRVLE
jgi:hypothetical protein